MTMDFLVEVGTEELPPRALRALSEAFGNEIASRLAGEALPFGEVRVFATPRRLAVLVADLAEQAPGREVVNWGPPVKVAFDTDGNPTKAAAAFADKQGLAIADLKERVEHDGKQDKLCYRQTVAGSASRDVLVPLVNEALQALPVPKRMRWGAGREEFVRPVHWVVMLYGDDVIPGTVLGIATGRQSRGHRFHNQGVLEIRTPATYKEALHDAHVMADFQERRNLLAQGVVAAAAETGGSAVIADNLLDEVTALTEWPVPLLGRFDRRFLDIPPEALISSMKEHQIYFHVVDESGRLLPFFVTVANIDSPRPELIVAGNERVIRPRLADAAFFYDNDRQQSLASRRQQLKAIVFQEKLGTLFDKTERVAALTESLAPAVGADDADARRAGELSKADLTTEMVTEFDDLQGIMGRYYARHDGESPEVAEAMLEQYLPAFAGDRLPATAAGTALALADRLDTLTGIFGIGEQPSGSRDPFALRRASLGVLRILVEKTIDLDLTPVLARAADLHERLSHRDGLEKQVLTYLLERFRAWYDEEGMAAEVFMAVQAKDLANPLDFHQRALAVHAFYQLPEAEALAAANKRVSNILAKAGGDPGHEVDRQLLEEGAETVLLTTLESVEQQVSPLLAERDYGAALTTMAVLRKPVDAFFDTVMVMAEDERLRRNRLALLNRLRDLFLNIADISLLAPAK